jgi:single-strand DNA-binding protein
MNVVVLTGRLTKDPEVKEGNTPYARFTLAVDRKFKKEGDTQTADFINCVCFSKQAEFVGKFFKKGMKMDLSGRLQTGSYTNKEGTKVNTVDVVADSVEFGESKGSKGGSSTPKADTNGFMDVTSDIEEELPFC